MQNIMMGKKILKNRFGLSEWSGAVGDLGTTLPIAFALVVFNGYPVTRIFLLWGLTYCITGFIFKAPVSVQPLKAMAIIAITSGLSQELLSTTTVFYGILFIILAFSGLIQWIQQWFSNELIRGIQLGIGLMLGRKAIELVLNKTMFLHGIPINGWVAIGTTLGIVVILFLGISMFKKPVTFPVIVIAIIIGWVVGINGGVESVSTQSWTLFIPKWNFLLNAVILLIIPQLPLTLGNAVLAANDACHEFWPEQAHRVTTPRLAGSIGISNIVIGLSGGFPICHGAGGIAAHARFGGKTGGTTIIIGFVFILLALVDNWSSVLFLIPIPILGALLLFDSWAMIILFTRLSAYKELIIAVVVGVTSLISQNLTFALLLGIVVQKVLTIIPYRFDTIFLQRFIKVLKE